MKINIKPERRHNERTYWVFYFGTGDKFHYIPNTPGTNVLVLQDK
ncbi:MAG: hypothetical protein ABIK93_01545 [candidate division WOR-3 bacterium]